MSKLLKLDSKLFVDSGFSGSCTIINNQNQMGYLHTHNYFETFLVISGSAIHHVNDKNFNLIKGSLVITRPEDKHCYLQPMSQDFQFINLIIATDLFNQILSFIGYGTNLEKLLNKRYPVQNDLLVIHFESLKATLEKLIAFPKTDIQRYNAAIKFTWIEILSHYFYKNKFDNKYLYPTWIKHLVSEMYKPENYSRGLPAMYEISNYSPGHLSRSFKKYLDTSPSKFLNELRIQVSAQSIIYTNTPIIDICENVGFKNLSHFYHLFKAKYKMSPNKYRKSSRSTSALESSQT